jgi:CheY-like chemotaxis protein
MTILYVDDDRDDQEIFKQALLIVAPDVTFLQAMDANQAFDVLRTMESPPDYLFLDLNMPGKDGKQFLIEMKMNQSYKKIPVIVYTTSSNIDDMQEVRRLGAIDFITKRDTLYEICQTLRIIL